MRELLVFGEKTFKISIPDDAKITFGPWSPPSAGVKAYDSPKALSGTLRVYENAKSGASVLAVFSGVNGYREEWATIWKSDEHGYQREERVSAQTKWVDSAGLLGDGKKKRPGRGKKEKEVEF